MQPELSLEAKILCTLLNVLKLMSLSRILPTGENSCVDDGLIVFKLHCIEMNLYTQRLDLFVHLQIPDSHHLLCGSYQCICMCFCDV